MAYNRLLFKYKNSFQLRLYEFNIKSSLENELDKYDVLEDNKKNKKDNSFDSVENEIDQAFSQFDDKYNINGRSAYVSINRSKNKIFYYARSNDWSDGYFCTLTINPENHNVFDYAACSELIKKFLQCLRNYDKRIYALFVPEKHKSGAFHFHGIISGLDLKQEGLIRFSGHTFRGNKIYNFVKFWKYGFTNVTKVENTLAIEKYISKYTTKDLIQDSLYQHRYFTLNLQEAEIIKYNLFDFDNLLLQELFSEDLVLYCDTGGIYNRCKYVELKNDPKVLRILERYNIMSMDLIK